MLGEFCDRDSKVEDEAEYADIKFIAKVHIKVTTITPCEQKEREIIRKIDDQSSGFLVKTS
jgi:hypothetical protein